MAVRNGREFQECHDPTGQTCDAAGSQVVR